MLVLRTLKANSYFNSRYDKWIAANFMNPHTTESVAQSLYVSMYYHSNTIVLLPSMTIPLSV